MKYLFFLAALIATATAADVICQCSAPISGQECTKNNTCTVKEGQCYSVERELYLASDKEKTPNVTNKGCQEEKEDPNFCTEGIVFISSGNDFYLLSSSVKCCKDKDKCNQNVTTDLPNFSELNNTISSKKLACPACFALNNKTCNDKPMLCKKDQDKCFAINGTITKGSAEAKAETFIAKGCATPNTILKKDAVLSIGGATYKLESVQVEEAKSGASQISSCLSFAILLANVLWFLLDSSLY